MTRWTKKDKGYLTKGKQRISQPMPEDHPVMQRFSDGELIGLHAQGYSDYAIADRLNVNRSSIKLRRYKLGLPANYPGAPYNPHMKIDPSMVLFYWIKGLNDCEIAYWLNVCAGSIRYHRLKIGLPIQGTRTTTCYVWKKGLVNQIKNLYSECGAINIAKVLGMRADIVRDVARTYHFTDRKNIGKHLQVPGYRSLTESEKEKLIQLSKPPKKRPSRPESPRTFTCQRCRRDFQALSYHRMYCDACKSIKELKKAQLSFAVWSARSEFRQLTKDNPDKAKKIIGEMMDEGEDIKTILQVADMIIEKLDK